MIHCKGLQWGAPHQPLTPPLSLHLEKGSLTAVVGPNGCGKSSLLKVIAGFQKPLAGSVSLKISQRDGVGFMPQQQTLDRQFPISLAELVVAGFWREKMSSVDKREQLQAAIRDWHLEGLEKRPLLALSGGELQRALLARLSLTDSAIMLLDEPHAALDEEGQQLLWHRIHQWHEQGRTLLVVCHDLAAVERHIATVLHVDRRGCSITSSSNSSGQQVA